MRRQLERCGDCTPGARCANHEACATERDAGLASEIGAAWAVFVRGQLDVRKPWPPFCGRAAEIAHRLVAELATGPRQAELARLCHWRAGLKWEALERPRIRDRPYAELGGHGVVQKLSGDLSIRFRTRRGSRPSGEARVAGAEPPWPTGRRRNTR